MIGAVAAALLDVAGCATIRQAVDPTRQMKDEALYLHGRVGRSFASVGFFVALPADVISLPVTIPAYLVLKNRTDKAGFVFFLPGLFVQTGFYFVGAGSAYPVYAYVDRPKERQELEDHRTKATLLDYYSRRMPYLSEAEYSSLVEMAHWTNAPPYREGSAALVRFGSRPCLWDHINYQWRMQQQKQTDYNEVSNPASHGTALPRRP